MYVRSSEDQMLIDLVSGLTEFYSHQQKSLEEIVALVRGKLPKNVRITLGLFVEALIHHKYMCI